MPTLTGHGAPWVSLLLARVGPGPHLTPAPVCQSLPSGVCSRAGLQLPHPEPCPCTALWPGLACPCPQDSPPCLGLCLTQVLRTRSDPQHSSSESLGINFPWVFTHFWLISLSECLWLIVETHQLLNSNNSRCKQ